MDANGEGNVRWVDGVTEQPLAREGYALIAAAIEVHKEIGGGLLEEIYQQSLELELKIRGIPFESKKPLHVYYKGQLLEQKYIPDLMVCDQIVVELKAVQTLIPEHEAQLINYMRITQQAVGYLINFAPIAKAQWKRFILSDYLKPSRHAVAHDMQQH